MTVLSGLLAFDVNKKTELDKASEIINAHWIPVSEIVKETGIKQVTLYKYRSGKIALGRSQSQNVALLASYYDRICEEVEGLANGIQNK